MFFLYCFIPFNDTTLREKFNLLLNRSYSLKNFTEIDFYAIINIEFMRKVL